MNHFSRGKQGTTFRGNSGLRRETFYPLHYAVLENDAEMVPWRTIRSMTASVAVRRWVSTCFNKIQMYVYPIGSMVLVYMLTWGILMGSMLPYMAYMDPMGI